MSLEQQLVGHLVERQPLAELPLVGVEVPLDLDDVRVRERKVAGLLSWHAQVVVGQ
jgi:hypothetical protein